MITITTGKKFPAVRAVFYAIAGFGKTSLASAIPGALFLDVEGSSDRYNVARIDARKHTEILAALKDLTRDAQGFQTLVIDTADWVQSAIEDAMCRTQNKPSIAECSGSFGKGYVEAGRKFAEILEYCDTLIFRGMNVVFLAHSAVKKVSAPGEMQTYDRYILALDEKNFATPLYEWAEMVLFGRFEGGVVETKEKRIKATSDAQRRTLHTSDSCAWFAKNRFSLPREIAVPTVEIGADGTIPAAILPPELAEIFAGKMPPRAPAPPPSAPAPVTEAAAPAIPTAPAAPATPDQIATLTTYAKNSVGVKLIEAALAHYGEISPADLTTEQAAQVITRCQEEMNKPATAAASRPGPLATAAAPFVWPAAFAAWLGAHEALVNPFLIGKFWINAGQTWRDLTAERAESLIQREDAFAVSAKIPARGGAV